MDDDWHPTDRLVALYEPTRARLAELVALLAPTVKRQPGRQADAATLDAVRAVLRDVERMTSRLAGKRLLPLHPPVTALRLLMVLHDGDDALDAFVDRYRQMDEETLEYVWVTEDLLNE